uniref:Uncharacterized protein n=1 Tax=Plectus sambesii TaxID=2011161 RepID=A0A914WP42_9BILA
MTFARADQYVQVHPTALDREQSARVLSSYHNSLLAAPDNRSLMSVTTQSENEVELCVVCGDVADGYHYSVLSCRGCNSFFRRATTMSRKFVCRRDGNCIIDKNVRCACRSCRLAKCVRLGMDPRAVQPKRDTNGHYNRKAKRTPASRSPTSPHLSESTPTPTPAPFTPPSAPASIPLTAMPKSPAFVFPAVAESRIDELIARYHEQCRRRRTMLCSSLEEILSNSNTVVLRRPVDADDFHEMSKIQMVLMYEWTEKLSEFGMLTDIHDKAKLLKSFAFKWVLLDNTFYTVESGFTDCLVMINNTYVSRDTGSIVDSVKDNADIKELKARLFGERALRGLDELVRPMAALGITTGEMMAFRVIVLWNTGDIGLSDAGCAIARKASDAIINDLCSWYERNNFSNIPERLGNLLLLLPGLLSLCMMIKEDVRIVKTFNLMEWDSFMDYML